MAAAGGDAGAKAAEPREQRAWIYTSTTPTLEANLHLSESFPYPRSSAKGGHPLGADEVVVRVTAAALNPVDYKLPELGVAARAVIPTPASPGLDYAGVVVAAGSAAARDLAPGTAVFGRVNPGRFGTLARFIVARRDGCAPLPAGLTPEHAACLGTAALTAYQTLQPYVKAGDRVFINGGSGGTGTFGIQVAKALGCVVTTSCSAANVELCRSLGADEVLDYTTQNVTAALKARGAGAFRLVVDNVGHSPPDLYKAADVFLQPGGAFVQVGAAASLGSVRALASRALVPSFLGGGKSKLVVAVAKNKHDDLVQLARWVQEGKLKPVVDEVFAYEDAPKAFAKLRTGRARGKIVVKAEDI